MKIYILLTLYFTTIQATSDGFCEKKFFYHQRYGYGYDISCEKLDAQTLQELSSAMVYNEILLTIKMTTLKSVKWHISKNLPQLREIDITNSIVENSNLFQNLRHLKMLRLENSTADNVSFSGINDLKSLNKLILKNNSLDRLMFETVFPDLKILNLNFNKLQKLKDSLPCKFPNLEELCLEDNEITEVSDVKCLVVLEKLFLDGNEIENVYLVLPELRTLSLRDNKIENLKTMGYLPGLEELNLEGNSLKTIREESFKNFTNLRLLNLKNNKLSIITENLFRNNLKLDLLDLENNKLSNFNSSNKALTKLLLGKNEIKSIEFCTNLPQLTVLDVSNNRISKIPNNIFRYVPLLSSLNLSFNDIGENIYNNSFFGLGNLQELDLSDTGIKILTSESLSSLRSLIKLNISNNKIDNFAIFEELHSLISLNVSYNKLTSLIANSLNNLKHLQTIDIEGNQIKNFEYIPILLQSPNLHTINIKNNSLSCEFLHKMIVYFKGNNVKFTIDNKVDYDNENVGGIYCNQQDDILLQGHIAGSVAALNSAEKNRHVSFNVDSFILITSLIVLFVFCVVMIVGVFLRIKRRNYVSDEVELLDRRKFRSVIL